MSPSSSVTASASIPSSSSAPNWPPSASPHAVRLDDRAGDGIAVLVHDPPANHALRLAAVEVVRLERDRSVARLGHDVLGGVGRREPAGDHEQTKLEIGVEVLQGKLAPPVADRGLAAVGIAGRSEDADALAGRGRADEDIGPGDRPAGIIPHRARQRRRRGRLGHDGSRIGRQKPGMTWSPRRHRLPRSQAALGQSNKQRLE